MKIYTIYVATNIVNGKKYVGFDSSWPKRQQSHKNESANVHGHTYNTLFHNAIRKYGWDNFHWEPIYQSLDQQHTLCVMEQYFIEQYRTCVIFDDCHGYNITLGGQGQLGRQMSQQTKDKKSNALIRKPTSRSKSFATPCGIFECITNAANQLSLHPRTIISRLQNVNMIEWYYLDNVKTVNRTITRGYSHEISTPYGIFKSIRECSNITGIPQTTITDRLKSAYQLDWFETGRIHKSGSRMIMTPNGMFDTITQASNCLNIPKSTIAAKLRSVNNTQWYYLQ